MVAVVVSATRILLPPRSPMSPERALLARLLAQLGAAPAGVGLGAGDDAAVVEVDGTPVAITVDVLIEGVHWHAAVCSPADVGWKALAASVSDLAAIGATPSAAVVGLQRSPATADADIEAVYAGLRAAADRWGAVIVGGDVVQAETLALSVTAIGGLSGRDPVTRAGARVGHHLVCIGTLGSAAAALAAAGAGAEFAPELAAAHCRPRALPAAGRILADHGATAMIDVSDGLGVDAAHLCRASGVAARLHGARVPVASAAVDAARIADVDVWDLAAGGGDDYALLAAVPADAAAEAARRAGEAAEAPAAVIGEVVASTAGQPVVTLDTGGGAWRDITDLGYEHGAG